MKRQAGVTLIELLIVIAIIGIISAIALPAYRDYVIRGQLTDSQASLGATRTRLEQYYQDNRSYPAECGGTAAGLPAFTIPTSQYFTYSCAAGAAAGQSFILTATGATGAGTDGFIFTVNEQGDRNTTAVPAGGWSTRAGCWITKKPNIC